ncbi:leucine carboxyl methyltransferase 1-like [Lingula anatina]|nr:leucine carboxyl methyltransferase 1-like [Lingula anatina]|eukprot:XP_013415836.2 leucine carboxyl methyltransferase 1-like [Lingula anatina]
MSSDDAVQSTNDDAAHCKRFAVSQGYWKDPYLQYFVKSSDRKAPEISRGYFARVSGVKLLLRQFIQLTKSGCQIVNLGAGFDTLYWLLQDEGLSPRNFTEIDFQGITSKKCYYIKSRKQLLEKIAKEDGEISFNSFDLHAANYHIVAADLRDVAQVTRKLHEAGIDPKLPTAFIAECVLVYMETSKTEALLKYFADHFHTAFFINYEQVNMEDRFGEVMLQNLRIRHCDLQGVPACRSLDTQKNR